MTSDYHNILLLGAFPQEIEAYKQLALHATKGPHASGKQIHAETVGVSKPIAAASTQRLIDTHQPDAIIFTGVAGALDDLLEIGDIGICTAAIDSDLDVRPWDSSYQRGEVPFTRQRVYCSDKDLVALAKSAPLEDSTKVFDSYIACGSKFLDAGGKQRFLQNGFNDLEADVDGKGLLPNTYDMESSAVLQVANANNIPCLVIRAISDTTRGDAPSDFNKFVERSVDCYVNIVQHILRSA
jgi:adenosylhomocysteine nucleosidase